MRIEWFFIWTNLSPHHPSSLCAKIGWNWPSGSGEEIFLNFVNVFSLFHKHLPLEIGGVLHLNKLKSPLPRNALCQLWLKLAQWFWRRNFFNFVNVFLLFRNYLHLEKDPSIFKDVLCQVWLKLAKWFWRRFSNFVNVFLLFLYYLPVEKGLHLNKPESSSPKDVCAKFRWNWPSGSGEEDENVKS